MSHRTLPSPLILFLLLLLSATASAQPSWKLFGNLAQARTHFGAIYIGNGEVLVIGGTTAPPSYDNRSTTSCELIDVNRRTIIPAAPLNIARAEFVTLLTPDSSVVVIGGNMEDFADGRSTPTVELYDRVTKRWRVIGSMQRERRQHVAAFINDREILIVGGRLSGTQTIRDAEIFDITTGTSRAASPFPFPLNSGVMNYSSTGALLAFAGREGGSNSYRERKVYRYDIASNAWLAHGAIADAINIPQIIKLWDGRLAISGGSKAEAPVDFVREVQAEKNDGWRTVAKMSVERCWSSMAQWRPDRIMTLGGIDNRSRALASTDWIDLTTGAATPGPTLIHPHSFFQTVTVPARYENGRPVTSKILAISGLTTMSSLTPAVEILEEECDGIVTTSPDVTICSGTSTQLSASGPSGKYRWSPVDGLSCTDCANPMAQPAATTTYTVSLIDALGCESSNAVTVTVLPGPDADAGPDITLCPGASAPLTAQGTAATYRWSPADGLSCTDCPDPIARPSTTTTYTLTTTSINGCSTTDEITVQVGLKQVRAHIPRDLVGRSDQALIVPVILDDSLDEGRIGSLRFTIRYDTTVLRLLAGTPHVLDQMTQGTPLDGWRIDVLIDSGGIFSALFSAPSTADYLRGAGEILRLQYLVSAVLKDSVLLDSELPFEISFPGADCYTSASGVGRVDVVICGLSHRLIEAMNGKYALKQNAPNPFNPTTSIEFSLGLDGHTTLTIHDAAGARVATLVDAYLEPGSHLYEWDASAHPSGLYYYCIVSGEWSRSGRMILLK